MSQTISYKNFDFTPVLGWSVSRYETFDKCKRLYYYTYYSKYVKDIPAYKIQKLRSITSVPLEIGNVVHDILEAFLRRLQKSDSNIDEKRFFEFAHQKADDYFSRKTFLEIYYGYIPSIDMNKTYERIDKCLTNFIESPLYNWIFMKAISNKNNWMIEPPGYGETRIKGLKAYCKMDFLFPVEDQFYILDWKTGKRDEYKHKNQIIGYAAATNYNFGIPWDKIFPKIVYLYPEFSEFEISLTKDDFEKFFNQVEVQTEEMKTYCKNPEKNIPKDMKNFPKNPSERICKYCNYQEICLSKNEIVEDF